MKRVFISAAIMGSAFIFTACATNHDQAEDQNGTKTDTKVASDTQQVSPYAPPIDAPVMDDVGYNRWPNTFRYEYKPGTTAGQ